MQINSINSINYQSNKQIKNTPFRAKIPMNIEYTAKETIPGNKLLKKFYKFLYASVMMLIAVSCVDNTEPSYKETSEYRETKKLLDHYKDSHYVSDIYYCKIDNTALDSIAKYNEADFKQAVNEFKSKTGTTKEDTVTFHNAMRDYEKTKQAVSAFRQIRKEYDEQKLLKKQQEEENAKKEYETARSDVEKFMSTN